MLKNNFNKRGQITIFIIIAVLLVAAIILLFWFYNRDVTPVQPDAGENPQYNIEHCINSYVEKDVNKLIENSGYIKKSNLTKNFNGQDIPYLCFVPINYARCIVVEPVLIEHLEKEIYNDIKTKRYIWESGYTNFNIGIYLVIPVDNNKANIKTGEKKIISSLDLSLVFQ